MPSEWRRDGSPNLCRAPNCPELARGAIRRLSLSDRARHCEIREQTVDYGVVEVNPKHELAGFKEKPRLTYEVSMGVYVVSRRVLDFIPPNSPYGFDNLMLDLLAAKKRVSVRPHDGYWLDIGRPDDYMQAIDEFSDMKSRLLFG